MNVYIKCSLGKDRTIYNTTVIPKVGDFVGIEAINELSETCLKVKSLLFYPTDELLKRLYIYEQVDVIVFCE